jgi:arginine N-succinyltransferase
MDGEFLIRSVREADLEELYRLSNMVFFINLPADREILKEKIRLSLDSFSGAIEDKFAREYILVMEDLSDGSLLGTSMIVARHGGPTSPHMYFELKEIHKYSETIHSGFIHKVLRLRFEDDGPTEIGGLLVNPNYRKHKAKLGRQLSYARFLFIKMKRRWFKNNVLSELMPPLTENDESILWEAVGRRFTNLSYQEADILSRKNKEFVTSLFPKGDIYTCLLPGEVRDAIGKVGPGAEPVKHMLERIGFQWKEHIDPFDGGPHYWAETDKITIVHETRKYTVSREPLKKKVKEIGLCGIVTGSEFACVQTPYELNRHSVQLPKTTWEALKLEPRQPVFLMPVEGAQSEKAAGGSGNGNGERSRD